MDSWWVSMHNYKQMIFFLFFTFIFSQTSEKKIITTGIYIGNMSPNEGYKKAREAAINLAIEKAVGMQVTSSSSLFKKEVESEITESYSNYFATFSNATVTSVKQISKQMKPLEENVLQFEFKAEIGLTIDKNGMDPGFDLKVALNKPAFLDGESLQISVESTKNAYITILNITQKNEVLVLFPNPYMKNNYLKKKEVLAVPSLKDMERGIEFEVGIESEDKSNISEMILVLATKEEIPIFSHPHESGFSAVTQEEFQKWVAKIPLNKRTMSTHIYEIYKKSGDK